MLSDYLISFGRIVSSTVKGASRAVLANVADVAASLADDTNGSAEGSIEVPIHGTLGIIARPDAPNAKGYAETVGIRTEDDITIIAARDLRLNKVVNPKVGEVALVQYGGGFLSLAHNQDNKGTTATLYAPFATSGEPPTNAHVLTLDTTHGNNSVSIVHSNGMAILMTGDAEEPSNGKVIIKNDSGSVYVEINHNGIVLNGNVSINGGIVGGSIASAKPLMLAPELLLWIGQVNAALSAINLAAGVTTNPAVTVPTAVPVPATKASAS
jgi:hypothetical protein